jgi:hypothetical protein
MVVAAACRIEEGEQERRTRQRRKGQREEDVDGKG